MYVCVCETYANMSCLILTAFKTVVMGTVDCIKHIWKQVF